jgi:hypothetical protein
MRLNPHVQVFGPLPPEMKQYLLQTIAETVDLDNPQSLALEEAFFHVCNRYDAETDFFNEVHNFHSDVLPNKTLAQRLQPYYDYVITHFLPDHVVFRSQVVKNLPGKIVHPHIDPRIYHRLSHRVHAVLSTNDRCRHVYFNSADNYSTTFFKMEPDFIYDFDNITPHAAFNLGDSDRLHVITDIIHKDNLEKYRHIFEKNPNALMPTTYDEYYQHLSAINEKYGDKDGLQAYYLAHLDNGEATTAIQYPG